MHCRGVVVVPALLLPNTWDGAQCVSLSDAVVRDLHPDQDERPAGNPGHLCGDRVRGGRLWAVGFGRSRKGETERVPQGDSDEWIQCACKINDQ